MYLILVQIIRPHKTVQLDVYSSKCFRWKWDSFTEKAKPIEHFYFL